MFSQQSFGYWLRLKRKSFDLTREGLAERVGCSAATVRKLEAEERRPSEQIVKRVAEIFEIPKNEREKFLRFARGELASIAEEESAGYPWQAEGKPNRSHVPFPVTSLISRRNEMTELQNFLSKEDIRLVTLVGPPGIGKTRLSMEIARETLPDFPDGVFFVALAPLDDASLIASTIAQTLGYTDRKNRPTLNMLQAGIGDKRLLLILDNCEHLVDGTATLASGLLSTCPNIKILATSRESFRIPGEQLYPVPALDIPKEISSIDIESTGLFPALTLFAERARAVRPDFSLSAENVQVVASICSQLDGLPLAIELIASRIRLMSPQALLDRMNAQFVLSADGMRAVSARQKTLKNAIQWSYDFLLPEEQKLFAYLSIFSGGYTLEAAEAVFSEAGFERAVSEIITSLSDKSLLVRTTDTQGEVRFDMLLPIQQFALDHLRHTGMEKQIRDAHLNYFVQYAELAEKEIRGPHQAEWTDRIENEHNNNRAALEWAVASQKTESAIRLLCALGWPWEVRGSYQEAFSWLDRIHTLPDVSQYPIQHAQLLNHIGRYYLLFQETFSIGRDLLDKSREITSQLGEAGEAYLAETLNWLGLLILFNEQGKSETAREMFTHGLELYKKWDNLWGVALSSFHLGILESELKHNDLSLSLFEQSYKKFQELGDLFFMGRLSLFLGYLYFDLDDPDQSRKYFEEHLQIDSKLKFWAGIAEALRDLGRWHQKYGGLETAQKFFEQSQVVCREHGLAPLA